MSNNFSVKSPPLNTDYNYLPTGKVSVGGFKLPTNLQKITITSPAVLLASMIKLNKEVLRAMKK